MTSRFAERAIVVCLLLFIVVAAQADENPEVSSTRRALEFLNQSQRDQGRSVRAARIEHLQEVLPDQTASPNVSEIAIEIPFQQAEAGTVPQEAAISISESPLQESPVLDKVPEENKEAREEEANSFQESASVNRESQTQSPSSSQAETESISAQGPRQLSQENRDRLEEQSIEIPQVPNLENVNSGIRFLRNTENLIRLRADQEAVVEGYRAVFLGIPESQVTARGFSNFLMERGYLPQAVAEYERKVALGEATILDRMELTKCYRQLGLLSKALIQAEQIVERNPQNAQGWRLAAEIHRELGDTEQAWLAAEKAFLYDASSPEITMLYYELRPRRQTLQELIIEATNTPGSSAAPRETQTAGFSQTPRAQRPTVVPVAGNRNNLQITGTEVAETSETVEILLPEEVHEDSELEIGIERIVNLQRLGLYSDARRLGRDLFARYPDNVRLLNLMGVINYRLGDRSSAAANLRRSLQLDPDQPVVSETLEKLENEMRTGL